MLINDLASVKTFFKPRAADSYKNKFGHALLIAGSEGKMGAALMAAQSALRGGLGLLTVVAGPEQQALFHLSSPEAMCTDWENVSGKLDDFSAIGIGPGMGLTDSSRRKLSAVLAAKNTAVIDADALSLLCEEKMLAEVSDRHLLTPHPGEFDRLFGKHASTEDRIATAQAFCVETGCVIVLKGAPTTIINGHNSYQNISGNQGLAKGGSGDILTGLLLALLSQGYSPLEAALTGVWLHGRAADFAVQQQSYEALLATDVVQAYGKAFRELY